MHIRTTFLTVGLLVCLSPSASAQQERGELRMEVRDSQREPVGGVGELVSELNQFRRQFKIGPEGRSVVQDLPFGRYHLSISAQSFADWSGMIEIRSVVPQTLAITLGIAPVSTQIEVSESATLIDPSRSGVTYAIGKNSIEEELPTQIGRTLTDLVNEQPGWLYEANGVLHPRGSEYDVQYVFDGMPLTQNRSPAFAPSLESEDVESLRVLTAGFPAEYGRKLGGIIEVTTEKNMPSGFHGDFNGEGGNFSSLNGSARLSYAKKKDRFSFSGQGFHTDRYLDPPVLQNYTNQSNGNGFSASYERDFTERDRLRVTISHNAVRYLVPNELVQHDAGQRQDVSNSETSGQIYFQHIISANLLFSASASVRDSSATLASNSLATPVVVDQNRGYREGYVRADLAGHHGYHDWKAGADSIVNPIHEKLTYHITDPTAFDPGTSIDFVFPYQRAWDVEQSLYIQDSYHRGNWNISAGLRFDHYKLRVNENAVSPRFVIARFIPEWSLLLHASYDRAFQTPAVENLLLASSPLLDVVSGEVLRIPVKPARANYYEGGLTKAIAGKLRIEANVFRRDFHNYSDDDVLLDTGVSFPIAFAKARIFGEELSLQVPHWWRFSGFLSYTNQSAYGQGPVTGGLFLGDDASNALSDTAKFAISQDQRNTFRSRIRFESSKRTWLAIGSEYGSGLPVEFAGNLGKDFLVSQYGPKIIGKVNFAKGRVKPNFSLGAAAGWDLYKKEQRSLSLQVQTENLTNRVNVINFAGLFSGTAVAVSRSGSARLRFSF